MTLYADMTTEPADSVPGMEDEPGRISISFELEVGDDPCRQIRVLMSPQEQTHKRFALHLRMLADSIEHWMEMG